MSSSSSSSSQNRINIRISTIYITSVINVIVTVIQSTLSKTSCAQLRALEWTTEISKDILIQTFCGFKRSKMSPLNIQVDSDKQVRRPFWTASKRWRAFSFWEKSSHFWGQQGLLMRSINEKMCLWETKLNQTAIGCHRLVLCSEGPVVCQQTTNLCSVRTSYGGLSAVTRRHQNIHTRNQAMSRCQWWLLQRFFQSDPSLQSQ